MNHQKPDAEARISKTRTQHTKTGESAPRQSDTAEGDLERVKHELRRQTEARKDRAKAVTHGSRPRDARLKPERKGVI